MEAPTTVYAVEAYTPEVATALGRLTTFLSDSASGAPIPEERLRMLVENDAYEQLVAERDGRIVGAATLTHIGGIMPDSKAYLEDFVTDVHVRGTGAGQKLWEAMEQWCIDRGLTKMDFTSSYDRAQAHEFYLRNGAVIRSETAPFRAVFIKK